VLEGVIPVRCGAPHVAPGNGPGAGVEQEPGRIEAVTGTRVERAVHLVAVLDLLEVEVEDDHGKDVSDPELRRNGDFRHWPCAPLVEQYQRARRGVAGIHGEIHAARHEGGPEGESPPRAQAVAGVFVRRVYVYALHGVSSSLRKSARRPLPRGCRGT